MIERREMLGLAGAVLAALPVKGVAAAQGIVGTDRDSILVSLVSNFFMESNKGHFGVLAELLHDDVEVRTNSYFSVSSNSKNFKDAEKYTGSGGIFKGKDDVLNFLRLRQQENGWFWKAQIDKAILPGEDYVSVFSQPTSVDGRCWGPGVLCGSFPKFTHTFWCRFEMVGDLITSSKIGAIYEADLNMLGDLRFRS